jgi:hypothetical protein
MIAQRTDNLIRSVSEGERRRERGALGRHGGGGDGEGPHHAERGAGAGAERWGVVRVVYSGLCELCALGFGGGGGGDRARMGLGR